MENLRIVQVKEIPEDVQARMTKSFVEQEKSHGIDIKYSEFALMLRKEDGTVLGVLNAFTWFAEVYVDDLWVDQPFRGRGYGKKLLDHLEQLFKDKGYNNINLVTNGFQAPEFYKKCGYQVEFVRENKTNPKLSKTFFIKYF